jgi:hypothetical protein
MVTNLAIGACQLPELVLKENMQIRISFGPASFATKICHAKDLTAKSWVKKLPKIWQAKCEKLANFGNQPNTSQNHALSNPWLGKF